MLEEREALERFAQRALESRRGRELRAEAQQLERRGGRVVEHHQPVAEAVGHALRVPLATGVGLVYSGGVAAGAPTGKSDSSGV